MNQTLLTGYVINMTSYYQDEFKDATSATLQLKNLTDLLVLQIQHVLNSTVASVRAP
jgi:hypothetical protein